MIKKKISLILSCLFILASLLSFAPKSNVFAYSVNDDIPINETTFPDPHFRTFIQENIAGGGNVLSAAMRRDTTTIDCSPQGQDGKEIVNFAGIEYFYNLEVFNCQHQFKNVISTRTREEVTDPVSLDLSSNTRLRDLTINDNNYSNLIIPNTLVSYSCSSCNFSSLDVSNQTNLQKLRCNNNNISSLDLSNNPAITNLVCSNNNLSSIDVSGLPGLVELNCSDNPNISSLDITNNTGLEILQCFNCNLSSIDLAGFTNLKKLQIFGNPDLRQINISDCSTIVSYYNGNPVNKSRDESIIYYNDRISGVTLQFDANATIITDSPSGSSSSGGNNGGNSGGNNGGSSNGGSSNGGSNGGSSAGGSSSSGNGGSSGSGNGGSSNSGSSNGGSSSGSNSGSSSGGSSNGSSSNGGSNSGSSNSGSLNGGSSSGSNSGSSSGGSSNSGSSNGGSSSSGNSVANGGSSNGGSSNGGNGGSSAPAASSETGVAGFVERLYTIALGRASDPVGKQSWIDAIMLNGNTGADVARGFLYSSEFLNKAVSNEEFTTVLYRTFFNREPDEAGFNAWVNALNGGASKQEVIEGFINSTEWANLCLSYGIAGGGTGTPNIDVEPNQGTIDFCTRLYTTCLSRSADQNGLMAWARQLANQRDTGTGAARGFFFSSEFTGQNVDNGEYVARLYRTFMGREPDQAGYDAWVGQLNSGVSREEVFNGFAQSSEFGAICASYGIIR